MEETNENKEEEKSVCLPLEQTEWRRTSYTNQVVTFYRATLTDL